MRFRGLAARVAATLAISMLPIGIMSFFQATQIARDEAQRQRNDLMTTTAEAAAGEALAIASAAGTVEALVSYIEQIGGSEQGCSAMFEAVVRGTPQYAFSGFIDSEGIVRCGSQAVGRDLSGAMVYPRMAEEQVPMVLANVAGQISQTSVLVGAAPVFADDGTWMGFVTVSVPHVRIRNILHETAAAPDDQTETITFNDAGEPLSASNGIDDIERLLPEGRSLSSLVTFRQISFSGVTRAGEKRNFAVVPIIPGVVYALGSRPQPSVGIAAVSPILFPALMLLAGILAAQVAVNRLVIGRLHELRRHMADFSANRRVLPLSRRRPLPRELAEIDAAWTELAERLMHDEAELVDMVHEKDVLLKEVHHRVKNNLQLIASIVNLKIRRATSNEARRSLKEVQGRVMSIAAVHQSLYSSPRSGKVRADELLSSVLGGIIDAGTTLDRRVDITREFQPVLLYPDQAVPLLLLASEAVSNALKYMGRTQTGEVWLDIALKARADGQAVLTVKNSCGTPIFPPDQMVGSGLGKALIAGFATQLGGTAQSEQTETRHDFQLVFSPAPFDPAGREVSVVDFDGSMGKSG